MSLSFDQSTFLHLCDEVCKTDYDLNNILQKYGYPPMWSRENTFESLVHIILEQQVSLASALAALNKLKERIQEITPLRVSLLTDEELRACYFSRQKTLYVKHLAEHIVSGKLKLDELPQLDDDDIRKQLCAVKGIGNWTVDVYLMFVLHRADVFPVGDLAAVNALKKVKGLPASVSREDLLLIAEAWAPYRTVATMLLWHFYLEERKSV
ncbi:DNA-3-methyladenine glycosylase 2 family protein [Mucilaginibacter sp. HMF5004]|uniref:DNA-3-methyladenine glycosylase family protein n=1 Tax=Mucilaginibacter rivuli TaxID=2857527 RepID=UPI001C5FC5E7|nr:DNA-3-methyladenine glycosylase 2 family protein [Mucilaginibacter rivuli]MBW4888282.1 DNA-3-methyladenine glycosylase 2 family protein [Mucilaginibacter rivuli]